MNKYGKIRAVLIMAMLILAGGYLNSIATYATESDDFSRPLYSLQHASEHDVGITFNSIKIADTDAAWYKAQTGKDLPKGILRNETNFVGAREDTGINSGTDNVWEGNEIIVEDGKTYIVRLYVHNNSQNGREAIAEDTKVRFYVPYDVADEVTVNGWLTSSNAEPLEYLDDVTFKSKDGTPFALYYISGSALLENGGCASGDGIVLPDSITNQGNSSGNADDEWTLIGYDALDGKVPGCYKYVNYVSIKVRVRYEYEFTTETQVRLAGDTEWQDEVEANIGDKVEFQITYQNGDTSTHNNVLIRNILPSNLRYIEGTTKLKNSTYPDTLDIADGQPSDILNTINIGDYAPGTNAKIMFTAEVVNDNLADGRNILYNWGQAGVGSTTLQDNARILVQNNSRFIVKVTVLSVLIFVCLISICVLLYRMHRWKQEHNA